MDTRKSSRFPTCAGGRQFWCLFAAWIQHDSTHLTTKWTKWTRLTFGVTRWIRWTLQTYKLPNFLRRHKLKFLRPEKSYQFAIECRCLGWSSFVEKTCRIRFTRVTKGTKVCRSPGVWRRHSLDPENSQVSEFGMFSKGKFQAEKDEWTQDLLSTKTFIKPCEFFGQLFSVLQMDIDWQIIYHITKTMPWQCLKLYWTCLKVLVICHFRWRTHVTM